MGDQMKDGKMPVTIREIAKEAKVSMGTVSHVLNETAIVSDAKKSAVLQAVQKLGYRPNQAARMLKKKHSKTVGLLIPDISNPYYAELARGVEDVANAHGYTVFVCNNDRNPEKEESYLSTLANKQVDGVIIVKMAGQLERVREYFAPPRLVLIDCGEFSGSQPVTVVNLDDYEGAMLAMNYLYISGHRKIAHITGLLESDSSRKRMWAYSGFMENIGVKASEQLIENGRYSYYGGYQAAKEILEKQPDITAIFAANDLMGMGAMQAIQDSGRRVPEDVSVIGYDDIEPAEYCTPKLTTIRQPKYEVGQYGMAMALTFLDESEIQLPLLPRNSLVVRQSVQKVAL